MTTFSQSSTNDLETYTVGDKSYLKMASGIDAYAVILADAVRTVRGELQLDTERGIPYIQTVFANGFGIDQWKNAVRNVIGGYSFVKEIRSFDADIVGKTISYKITILTDAGEVAVES